MADRLKNNHIVCLGGGIGTVNLIKGLKDLTSELTVVVSMADEGGSAGRLRRKYNIFPPGDVVSCLAALSDDTSGFDAKLLTYRFPGDRYGGDDDLAGHKMGNLLMVAARDLSGSFVGAIEAVKKLFNIKGNILPATDEAVSISAITVEGKEVHGEEAIDLGKYPGKRVLDTVYLTPRHPKISQAVLQSLEDADTIIAGPGDLYTTILPVLIIPEIAEYLKKTKKPKVFVVNVANKPFETKGYSVSNFIHAVEKHIGEFPFDSIIVNDNTSIPIPNPYHYAYVRCDKLKEEGMTEKYNIVFCDLVNDEFPLYHDSKKLAEAIKKTV